MTISVAGSAGGVAVTCGAQAESKTLSKSRKAKNGFMETPFGNDE